MATFVTSNKEITTLDRTTEIYILTDSHSPLNYRGNLGFWEFFINYDKAKAALKRVVDSGYGRTRMTTIDIKDEIEYHPR